MIALVIHRFGKDIVGGAEQYAYKLAQILSEKKDIEIITTTAIDHNTWQNHYEPGLYYEEFPIRRFSVDITKSPYWQKLHDLAISKDPSTLSISFCEEWIKHQGPYSSSMLDFLRNSSYEKYIFVTYLYPTTYFGVDLVQNAYIIPTYHDEPPFYFPIFQKYRSLKHLFLTSAEKDLALRHIAPKEYDILGFGIEEKHIETSSPKERYFLYAGRIEPSKGVAELADYYARFYQKHKIPLYIIGQGDTTIIQKDGIIYKGFVSEEEKLSLMKNATAFIHPSPNESLGIVLIESFSLSTPALVTAKSQVLHDHISHSKGGKTYKDYDEFEQGLLEIMDNRPKYAVNAYNYFKRYFDYWHYKEKIWKIFS